MTTPAPSRENTKILVVDDEATARENLGRFLAASGYTTAFASDGQEALELASAQIFDMVLMDIKMPRMSGLEALDKFHADYPFTLVIMITAMGELDTAVEAVRRGAYDYIVKPIHLDAVLLKVEQALQQKAAIERERNYRIDLENRVGGLMERQTARFAELVQSLEREHKELFEPEENERSDRQAS